MGKSITHLFLNSAKREAEAVAVTLPAILNEGGGRNNVDPEYAVGGVDYTAAVVPAESISGRCYLLVEEAFAAGTTVTVKVGGLETHSAAAVSAAGVTVSSRTDQLFVTGGDVVITLSGTTNHTVGKLKVIMDYVPYNVKNGRFSETPLV